MNNQCHKQTNNNMMKKEKPSSVWNIHYGYRIITEFPIRKQFSIVIILLDIKQY